MLRVTDVTIGVHVHAEPSALHATLTSLRAHSADAAVILLPDGPDSAVRAAVDRLTLPTLATRAPLGGAACFNRLAQATSTPIIVLLESGSIVSAGWLDILLTALDADPHHGLAGPSTNESWNEQAAFRGASARDVDQTARTAATQFGHEYRTLEPLHSLADFCYAVKREVIDAIGAADEGYGQGPCWEMDYNIRAARAGLRGVWAQGAYVYRAPFTARRAREERVRFEASKRRYQDKFCALRLNHERAGYEAHCRGDACEHFAPPALIQIRLPFAPTAEPALPIEVSTEPLISCIMPTRDRAAFALQSIAYFQRQLYPNRELIILDDGADNLAELLPPDQRIRYERCERGTSIGAKRNRGCQLAHGELIAQWDDDDWYAPDRLSVQAAPLTSGTADITALKAALFFDLPSWSFWRCSAELHRRLFQGDVHGGTLVFRRHVWERWSRYPDASLAEDAALLMRALRKGARLERMNGENLFLYVRHGANSWGVGRDGYPATDGWLEVAEPQCLASDRAFYRARSVPQERLTTRAAPARPLVSCIMPTADRHAFVQRALAYFERQTYEPRELIVVDDGESPVQHLLPRDPRVRYFRLEPRQSIGWKRNFACEQARGTFVVHWDDDDWMADWRLEYQVGALLRQPGLSLCGLDRLHFYDISARRAWEYAYPPTLRPWVAGGTFCYPHTLWRSQQFPPLSEGEDTRYLWSLTGTRIVPLSDPSFYVAMIHRSNTSRKRTSENRWQRVNAEQVRARLGVDLHFYDGLAGGRDLTTNPARASIEDLLPNPVPL